MRNLLTKVKLHSIKHIYKHLECILQTQILNYVHHTTQNSYQLYSMRHFYKHLQYILQPRFQNKYLLLFVTKIKVQRNPQKKSTKHIIIIAHRFVLQTTLFITIESVSWELMLCRWRMWASSCMHFFLFFVWVCFEFGFGYWFKSKSW